MELRSFIAGMLFLIGLQILLPVLEIKVEISLPYSPYSKIFLGIVAIVLSYYIFKSN
jgi:hypothetical protein